MEYSKKQELSSVTSQIQALNTMQANYLSQMIFINEIRNILDNAHDKETGKYRQEDLNQLIENIDYQIDDLSKSSIEVLDQNYYIGLTVKGLTDKMQEIL